MAWLISSGDSGAAAADASHPVVFVDTSLDTHLAMTVSPTDTASDLKGKLIQAHQLCFPKLGEIKIDAVKVKRRGQSYHLSDSMLVISAFNGWKKDWFLLVDASSPVEHLPCPAITEETPNAIVEFKESDNVHGTTPVLENGSEASEDLRGACEGHGLEVLQQAGKHSGLPNEGSPLEIGPSNKRRKLKRQALDILNPADTTVMPSGKDVTEQIHEDMMEVGTGHAVTNPEKAIVLGSVHTANPSEALDRTEKTGDVLVQQADAEMNDLGAGEKKSQTAADCVDGDRSLPRDMDVGLPSVGDTALANNQLLETGQHDMNEMLQSHDANAGAEEVSVSHGVASETIVENTVSPKRRKKSSRSKTSAGEKSEKSNLQNLEGSPVDNTLIKPQQVVNCSQFENRLNDEKNLSEAEGSETAVMDAEKKSGEEHGLEKVLSWEVTENAESAVDKLKKSNKTNISKEKKVDQKGDRPEEEQSNQPDVEIGVSGEVSENAENTLGKTKKRTKKRGSKHDQTSHVSDKEQSNPSKDEGKEAAFSASDQRSDRKRMDEMGSLQHIPNKAAVPDKFGLEIQRKKTRKRSSKEKDYQSIDNIGKELSYVSQAEGRDEPALDADGKEHGNETGPLLKITGKSAEVGNHEKTKTKTKATRQSSKRKTADGIDKESHVDERGGGKTLATVATEHKSYEQNGSEMEQSCQVSGKSAHADSGKDKRKKKTTGQSSKDKKNADQSSDRIDKDQSNFSNMEEARIVATKKSEGEDGNEGQPSQQIIEQAKVDENDQKTREKTKNRGSKDKNIDQSCDMTEKEKRSSSQGVEGTAMVVVNADKSSNLDHADNNGEKADKRSRSKQSSKKSARSNRESKDPSDSTMKEDASNFGNSVRVAKRKKSEAIDLIAEPNNLVDKLHEKGNIDFREFFKPQQYQQEVAASGNSSVGEGPRENRAGSDLKVKSGKRKAATSALTGSLQLNEHTGEEQSRSDKPGLLISPAKKLHKTHRSGSQASAFPKPKTIEYNVNTEEGSENSAASASGLKNSKKPRRASKSTSSIDRFHVAIRKPSKYLGEVVDSSERKKSLLSLADSIFEEESSASSKHEGVENSDASTRTPSDNMLSDCSDSDILNDGYRRNGGRSKGKSRFKDVENLTIDRILRSSSGYKKARKAAESQLDDTESPPVDFVPDSQGNL